MDQRGWSPRSPELERVLGIALTPRPGIYSQQRRTAVDEAPPTPTPSHSRRTASIPVRPSPQLGRKDSTRASATSTDSSWSPPHSTRDSPLALPTYIYTQATPEQVSSAKEAGTRLNLNNAWVKVYQEPDVLTAPLRISAITVLIALFAGIVILLATSAQARGMRPALAGLRAVGMDGGFLARVVGVRVGLTAALATVFGLVSSAIGGRRYLRRRPPHPRRRDPGTPPRNRNGSCVRTLRRDRCGGRHATTPELRMAGVDLGTRCVRRWRQRRRRSIGGLRVRLARDYSVRLGGNDYSVDPRSAGSRT